MAHIMDDDVFGRISFEDSTGCWERAFQITFLEQSVDVELLIKGNDESHAILPQQRSSFMEFLQRQDDIVAKVAGAIFDYYREHCDELRRQYSPDEDEFAPVIDQLSQLTSLVQLGELVFPLVLPGVSFSIGFGFDCDWEPCHGLGVLIQNETIEVGLHELVC